MAIFWFNRVSVRGAAACSPRHPAFTTTMLDVTGAGGRVEQSFESLARMNVNESTLIAPCAGYRVESEVVRSAGYDWFASTYRGPIPNPLVPNSPGAGTSPSVMLSPNARIVFTP